MSKQVGLRNEGSYGGDNNDYDDEEELGKYEEEAKAILALQRAQHELQLATSDADAGAAGGGVLWAPNFDCDDMYEECEEDNDEEVYEEMARRGAQEPQPSDSHSAAQTLAKPSPTGGKAVTSATTMPLIRQATRAPKAAGGVGVKPPARSGSARPQRNPGTKPSGGSSSTLPSPRSRNNAKKRQ
jgi:hypothetical protein